MALQSLVLPILSVFRSAGLQQASGVLRQMTGNFDSLAGKIGLAAGSFSAFSALTTARQFAIESVNATQQFERNLLALNQVFENLQPRMVGFTQEVENYGLSQQQAAQASVFLGSVLKQYGFSVNETANQTERLVMLAQDLATTYGYDVQEALLAITALFRGEYDPIEKFGVAMKQNEVNARLAAQGQGDLEGAALANAQAIARLDMLFERAADSVGAFTRASDTLYASQQRLNAVVGNLQIAFGSPLQKPLAEINNIFADLVQQFGPEVVEIGNAIGSALGSVAPIIGQLTTTVLQLIAPLEQVIEILAFAASTISTVLWPAIEVLNGSLGILNSLLDAGSAIFGIWGREVESAADKTDNFKRLLEIFYIDPDRENTLEAFTRRIDSFTAAVIRSGGSSEVFASNLHLVELGAISAATEATNLANKGNALDEAFRSIADGSVNAEGKLEGLAGVFQRIDDAIAQSSAKQEMEDLGLSAAFIEEVLTRPNWQEIFGKIAYYAKITAAEVQKITIPGVGVIETGNTEANRQRILNEINQLFGVSDSKNTAGKAAQDFVADFFSSIKESIRKESARLKLESMGASEGLIEAILGSAGWEKVFKRVVSTGIAGLKKLQAEFNKTTAGLKELAEQQKRLLEEAQNAIDANIAARQAEYDEALAFYQQVKARAEEFKKTIKELSTIPILPDVEPELGRFESSILNTIQNIQAQLKNAFENDVIFKKDFKKLQEFVEAETAALLQIAKQRDELANRYALSKALISEYQTAIAGALQLTSLFSRLKSETEKRTVTEVTSGVVKMGKALREFGITIERSYEETIDKVANKTEGLLSSFRDVALRARTFAENLRALRDMGLDPMLFNQLVQAGAEAGGETAQAIVDGGIDSVNELNAIYDELNLLGAELGLDVGQTMYDAGKDMTYGLLEGIKSEQEALLALAESMAEAFAKAFAKKLNSAANRPVAAANASLQAASAALQQAQGANAGLLAQVEGLIQGANTALASGAMSAQYQAGVGEKLEIFQSLIPDIVSGAITSLPGLQAGLSTADVQAIVNAARPSNSTTVYNVNVTADTRLSGSKAGEAVVETLQRFSQNNGNFVVGVSG